MRIGVPKETLRHEHRVGLTPFAVSRLVNHGHQVYIERDAGKDSHFSDEDYTAAGATIVYRPEEAYGRADLVCRVSALGPEEVQFLTPGTTLLGFQHLAVAPKEVVNQLIEREVTVVGYEIVEGSHHSRPVLSALGEIAGRMVINTATTLLEHESGGRGIILGSVPGVAPATVVVLGGGTVGRTAAATATALGAHVIVLDMDIEHLRRVVDACQGHNIVTAVASKRNLARYTEIADVLIGAVMVPGGRSPYVVSEQMVASMKPGSAIIDVAIDQGGCVETSRPTTLDDPTFKVNGVTHFCVPNITTNAPRTASRALSISAIPHILEVANEGLDTALRNHAGLARGVYLYRGRMVNQLTAETLGLEHATLADLIP